MNQARTPAQATDARRHRRVNVRLSVTVVPDRHAAFEACSSNISEGGMLLRDYSGPELAPGRLVGLNIGGVISDAGDDAAERYLMRVVRQEGDRLALRFAAQTG